MRHSALGISLKVGATLAFSLMYVAIRLAGHVPVGETVFFRATFALIPLFIVSIFTVGPAAVVITRRPLVHLGRSIMGVASMFLNFAALKMLPLAELTGLSFVMPIFAVVLAALVLHERVGPMRGTAVVVGFGGVLLMVQPHGGAGSIFANGLSAGSGLALTGALLSAFVVIFIRQMSATERSETIVFYFMSITSVVSAVTLFWAHVPLTAWMIFWLVMGGILGGIGQICMTYSYRFAEPSLLASFDYVAMIWATVLGYSFFGEVPEMMVLIGAIVVIGSGLFIFLREHRIHRITMTEPAPL